MALKEASKFSNTQRLIVSFLCVSAFLFFLSGGFIPVAEAATIIFGSSASTYIKGSPISVDVLVSSPDKTINAASGTISFPADLLSVSSISKTGSIIDFWAQEPSFSNYAGTINFEGAVLPPWYTGGSGKIFTITFKTKESGTANVSFTAGSVLAADGTGTDVITGTGRATYNITEGQPASPAPVEKPSVSAGTPSAPEITSSTHPDPNKWYAVSTADFSWNITKDTLGTALLIGKNPTATPTVVYAPAITSKEIKDLADGVWYFHVQSKNANGWGTVSDFRLQIDTEKPTSFDITEVSKEDSTDPAAKFIFKAKDATSGIDHYEVQVDNGDSEIWTDDGSHTYETAALDPGKHTLIAKAVDAAGNSLAASVDFEIAGLNPPTIIDYPKELQSGESLTVYGSTYANSKVTVWLQKDNEDPKAYTVTSDKNGNFSFTSDNKLTDGMYLLWAEAVDGRGAKSSPTDKITISVTKPALFVFGNWAVSFLGIVVPLLALVFVLIFIIWYGWRKFSLMRKHLRKEVRDTETALHKAFDLLRDSVQEQVKVLEKTRSKRELTIEEEKINRHLKKDLEDAESYIRKEIENIEKLIDKKS